MDDHRRLGVPGAAPWAITYDRSLDKAFSVKLARRWLVDHPLRRQWDRMDEVITATRGTRA